MLELEPQNKDAGKEVNFVFIPCCLFTDAFVKIRNVRLIKQYVDTAKNLINENKAADALKYLERASSLTSSKKIDIYKAEALLGLKEYDRALSMMT